MSVRGLLSRCQGVVVVSTSRLLRWWSLGRTLVARASLRDPLRRQGARGVGRRGGERMKAGQHFSTSTPTTSISRSLLRSSSSADPLLGQFVSFLSHRRSCRAVWVGRRFHLPWRRASLPNPPTSTRRTSSTPTTFTTSSQSDDFNFYFSPRPIDHAETTEVGGFAPPRGTRRKTAHLLGLASLILPDSLLPSSTLSTCSAVTPAHRTDPRLSCWSHQILDSCASLRC